MFNDAQLLLRRIVDDCSLTAAGAVGFYRARADGDDINLYDEKENTFTTIYGLRQQVPVLV